MTLEEQYYNSLKNLSINGTLQKNRTGIDTYKVSHQYFFIDDVLNNFPELKCKKLFPKLALKELFWMLSGKTDIKWLNDRGVNYWNEWANKDGTIGKSYGYQFRSQKYVKAFESEDIFIPELDPLLELIDNIIKNPISRRLILNLWNHKDIAEMSLPPCVYDYHFDNIEIEKNKFKMNLHVTQRSADSFLGVPYDFMFVGFFLSSVVWLVNKLNNDVNFEKNQFIVGDIHYTCHDYHLYSNHVDQLTEYCRRFEEDKLLNNSQIINGKTILKIFGDNNEFVKCKSLDDFINYSDKEKYSNFEIIRNWDNNKYGKIIAPLAI